MVPNLDWEKQTETIWIFVNSDHKPLHDKDLKEKKKGSDLENI